jgi:type II secretory pathway predicted ATPase ExeA
MPAYFRYFGLERDPFLDTADPYFYCELGSLRRARERVAASLEGGRGLAVVLGEPGTGKTSLAAALEGELLRNDRIVLGKILDPSFSTETEFLIAVGRVFGVALPPRSPAALRNALKNYLYETAAVEKRTPVLIVDEAQTLSDACLESLRTLMNFQIPERKLLNVALFGQNELEERLREKTGLADRVDVWFRLDRLDDAGAAAVFDYRLERAGPPGDAPIFSHGARALAIAAAGGIPRRLNALAHDAMQEAADRASTLVNDDHVRAAVAARGVPAHAAPKPAHAPSGATFFARLFARWSAR